MELLVATKNQGKLDEIRALLKELPLRVTSLADYPHLPDVAEDGATFRDNAVKKAVEISRQADALVMGEDSGLEVDALGGAPGVHSARFASAGEGNAPDEDNNAKLLRLLKDVPPPRRTARYHCLAALARSGRLIHVVDGRCEGRIAERLRGSNGFGYDPLFLIPSHDQTFGELDPSVKAGISHRAAALRKIKHKLEELVNA